MLLRKFISLIPLFFLPSAKAGWWTNFCEKFIAEDPYQFEEASIEWLENSIYFYAVRERLGTLSRSDAKILEIMRRELKSRKKEDNQ